MVTSETPITTPTTTPISPGTIGAQEDVNVLQRRPTRYRVWVDGAQGLCVRVQPSGSKAWFYEYRDAASAKRSVKLGPTDRMTLRQAKAAVRQLGADPAADRMAARAKEKAKASERAQSERRVMWAFLANDYADHLAATRDGDATARRLHQAWGSLMDRDMAMITALDIERIRRHRLKAGISPQTINRDWSALRALLNAARRAELIAQVPMVQPLRGADNKRVRWLGQRDHIESHAQGERERFLAALEQTTEPTRTVITVLYWTGLRRGEALSLEWRDVDLERAQLVVRAESAKSGKARHIPMLPQLIEHLATVPQLASSPLVCPSPKTGLRLTGVKSAWKALTGRAQLVDFRLHDIRHDYASRLVQRGIDLYTVRDLLGHSTVLLTERYSHLAPDRHRAAVEALA